MATLQPTTYPLQARNKFAVVEYTSKSGQVWRHSNEHPNYLANPVTELDPTSFGCYVSAMNGQHIPLKGLIVGPVENVSGTARLYRKIVKRLSGNWPQNYSLQHLQQFDALLVVHQLSDAHELTLAIRRLKQLNPHPKIIGVPTQPYGILKDAFAKNPKAQQELKDFMDSCDVFLSIVEDTVSWYQEQTKTKVIYMPQPYPVEYARQYFVKPQDKANTILVAGVTQRDNIKKGQTVARELQKKHRDYMILVPKVHDLSYDFSELYGSRYEILPFEEWQAHLKTLSKTKLVINTDYTRTRGRVQVDCAAVGTATIGANSDAQRDLYPAFIGTPDDTVDTLVAQGDALLTDTALYDKTITQAIERMAEYSYEKSRERLEKIL